MDITNAMSKLDDIKEKLSSDEYNILCKGLKVSNEKQPQFYEITYLRIYITNGHTDSCCGEQGAPNVNYSTTTAYFRGVKNSGPEFDPDDGTCDENILMNWGGIGNAAAEGASLSKVVNDFDGEPKGLEHFFLLSVEKLTI
jgi:hypothetical protein